MSAGIVQLVATGPQDTWLTGDPQVSFYRSSFKRHTHYASAVTRQVIQGAVSPGGMSTIVIEKGGDLVSYIYLTANDTTGAQVPSVDWSKVIDRCELVISGQVVDSQDFEYMCDIEPVVNARNYSQRYLNNNTSGSTNAVSSFFPLKFFFNKDNSLALPLVSMQYVDVVIRIYWATTVNTVIAGGNTTVVATVNASGSPYLKSLPSGTITGNTSASATSANFVMNGATGVTPYPGMLVSPSATPGVSNCAVIQSLGFDLTAVSPATVAVQFSTSAASAFALSPASTLYLWDPLSSALVTAVSGSTITIADLSGSTAPAVGQLVFGLTSSGSVSVAGVSGNTVTLTSSVTGVPTGSIVGFFAGSAAQLTASTTTSSVVGMTGQYIFTPWVNYIFLDDAERDFFANKEHNMLITQVQRVPMSPTSTQELALSQPVKFIAWPAASYASAYAAGNGALYKLKVQINGIDCGTSKHLPAYQDIPQYYQSSWGYMHNQALAPVAMISYSIDTCSQQPTGTLNFSRIDTFRLITSPNLAGGIRGLANPAVAYPYFYAVNYNVFRINKGVSALLYS